MSSAELASVPAFSRLPLRECCTFMSGGTPSKADPDNWSGAVPWASPKDLKRLRLTDTIDHISAGGLSNGSTLAPAGSVFVVVRGMILAKDVPVAQAAVPMAFNQDLKAIVPGRDVVPDFLPLAIAANKQHLRDRLGRSAHGTRSLLSEDIATLEIPLPERDEQHRIAAILWKVQRAIEVQEQFVATVRELKQAAMRELFTRGLRGEAQKETAIGMVPESWDVVALGGLGRIGNGSTPKRDNESYWSSGTIPWLNSGKIHEGVIVSADQFVTPHAVEECHLPIVPSGSLLVAITGQGKTLGNVARVTFDTTVNQHLAYFVSSEPDVDVDFLRYFLASRYESLRAIGSAGGSTKGAITCADLRVVLVPRPRELSEQHEIASALHTIDRKLAHHERKRDTLQDLFKTLLHELMTGRIRVHELDLDITEPTAGLTGGEAA